VKTTDPARSRAFTRSRNNSAEYRYRNAVKPYLLEKIASSSKAEVTIPGLLEFRGRQLARAMTRADQMDKRCVEIEQYVMRRGGDLAKESPVLAMTEEQFSRWCYCREASRRADESADKLLKSLDEFSREHSKPTDIFTWMAQAEDVPEEPPGGEPPERDPPEQEPPIREPDTPSPAKSVNEISSH
jgi:hypothetical protein